MHRIQKREFGLDIKERADFLSFISETIEDFAFFNFLTSSTEK